MEVFRNFRFHSARYLPKLDENHICNNIHGHTFNLTVHIKGKIDQDTGFVIDFYTVDEIVNLHIIKKIDHKLLNDIKKLDNPTSENLCIWIWNNLKGNLKGLYKIVLSEDHGTGISYSGE